MLDTNAIARELRSSGLPDKQADAITAAVRRAAEHREHQAVTRGELYRALLLQTFAILGGVAALVNLLLP